MPRYLFDVHTAGTMQVDELGTDLPSAQHVPDAAMRLLPDLARDVRPKAGEHYSFVVMVRDEKGSPVFSATLGVTGLWLEPKAPAA